MDIVSILSITILIYMFRLPNLGSIVPTMDFILGSVYKLNHGQYLLTRRYKQFHTILVLHKFL